MYLLYELFLTNEAANFLVLQVLKLQLCQSQEQLRISSFAKIHKQMHSHPS